MTSPHTCLALLTFLATLAPVVPYRQLHFTNADVCASDGETQTINTGEGALILSLTNKSYTTFGERKICNILIKAKSGYGLLVYAEDFRLRTNSPVEADCHDYIEFGREDDIPLWTRQRSGKLCGTREGVNYQEPGGQLLIWLSLGPASPPGPPSLSLVITPYNKERQPRGSGYCECAGPWQKRGSAAPTTEQWIRCKYFCDGRVNCALDSLPADEADVSCSLPPSPPHTPHTGGGLLQGGRQQQEDTQEAGLSQLSLASMAALGLLGLVLIACGILCTLKRSLSAPSPPACQEQALSMAELARLPGLTQENIYCPGPLLGPRGAEVEAPPPSYHEIFPPDYVPPDLRPPAPESQGAGAPTPGQDPAPRLVA